MNFGLSSEEKEMTKRCNSEPSEQNEIKRKFKFDDELDQTNQIYLNEKFLTVEWENYFNDGFDIYSINNGIVPKRYSNNYEQVYPNENIEFKIDNLQEFSFKENVENEDIKTEHRQEDNFKLCESIDRQDKEENDLIQNEIIINNRENDIIRNDFNHLDQNYLNNNFERIQPDDFLLDSNKNTPSKEERESLQLDLNENNFLSEQFLKDEEYEDENNNYKEKLQNENIIKSEPNKNNDIIEQHDEYNYESNKLQIKIDDDFRIKKINLNKHIEEDRPQPYNIESNTKLNSTNEETNLNLLKKKDEKIKKLNEKLDTQISHNRIILDENKKLLEIINIFKVLQDLEKQKDIKKENREESSKIETNQNLYKTENISNKPSYQLHKEIIENNYDEDIISSDNIIDYNTNIPYIETHKQELEMQVKMEYIKELPDEENQSYSYSNDKEKIDDSFNMKNKTYINTHKVKKTSYGEKYLKSIENLGNIKNKTFNTSLKKENSFKNIYQTEINKNNNFQKKLVENSLIKVPSKSILRSLKKSEKENIHDQINSEKMNENNYSGITSIHDISPGTNNYNNQKEEKNYNNTISSSFSNINRQNNSNQQVQINYNHIIQELENYRELNEKLISNLNKEDFSLKIDLDKRKKEAKNLESVLVYINSVELQQKKEHMIPFYLLEKNKIYKNIISYISDKRNIKTELKNETPFKKSWSTNKIKK